MQTCFLKSYNNKLLYLFTRLIKQNVKVTIYPLDAWILLGGMYTPGNVVEWVTGEEYVYSNWNPLKAFDVFSNTCIEMAITASQPDGLWNTFPCGDHAHFYVCEKEFA